MFNICQKYMEYVTQNTRAKGYITLMITSPIDTDSRGAFKTLSYDAQKQPQDVFCKKSYS